VARGRTVVVTRHAALAELLRERGLIGRDANVISHATVDDVQGAHVIGILPLALAAHALSVTEIPLAATPADRGVELSLHRMREIAGPPQNYVVQRVPSPSSLHRR
jgi:hypothetical protein